MRSSTGCLLIAVAASLVEPRGGGVGEGSFVGGKLGLESESSRRSFGGKGGVNEWLPREMQGFLK